MLLKVVFDKTAFVEFKLCNNLKRNIAETHSKQPKIHTLVYGFKNLYKIYRLAYWFLFFEISISEICESEEIREFY